MRLQRPEGEYMVRYAQIKQSTDDFDGLDFTIMFYISTDVWKDVYSVVKSQIQENTTVILVVVICLSII